MNNPNHEKEIQLSPGIQALMNRMMDMAYADETDLDEEIAEVEKEYAEFQALPQERQDAESKAAGFDFESFDRWLQKTVDDFTPTTVVQRLADGIEKLLQGSRTFLRLTQEGLDELRATYYAPATLRGGGGALAVAMETAGIEVVALSLAMKPEGIQLMLRWLRDMPAQPPTVSVRVAGKAQSVRAEWPGWDGALERAQKLRLVDCGIDAATWAAATQAEKPLLLYRWERETNQLHVELLPLVETA